MDFNHVMERGSLEAVKTFLREREGNTNIAEKMSYREKLHRAEQQMEKFLRTYVNDLSEYNDAMCSFYALIEVYEDVYFEIGLPMGVNLTAQISKKLEALAG